MPIFIGVEGVRMAAMMMPIMVAANAHAPNAIVGLVGSQDSFWDCSRRSDGTGSDR